MANFTYNVYRTQEGQGLIDLREAGDDIRVLLLEANSDVNPDDLTVAAVLARAGTTELTSTGYARQTTGSQTMTQSDSNDRAVFDGADITFSAVQQATTETVVGGLVYKHVTNDADSIPIAHFDVSPAVTPNGSDIAVQWHADGILYKA